MFGTWRLLLAGEVLLFHLIYIPVVGTWAVGSFFVLSGFLMTAVMHRNYGYSAGGFAAFALNRALRLLPGHWFACLFSLGLIALYGGAAIESYHKAIAVPASAFEWFQALSMVYLSPTPIYVVPRLAPPTWALTVELVFYVLIGLGLSRGKGITLVWLAASLGYVGVAIAADLGRSSVYGSILSGSLPFALGAASYHWRDWIARGMDGLRRPFLLLPALRYGLVIAAVAVPLFADWRFATVLQTGNLAISAAIVVALFPLRMEGLAGTADRLLGDYSYPVYLLHWQAGAFASFLLFGEAVRGFNPPALLVFCLGMVILAGLASVAVFLIDRPVEQLRSRLRARAASARNPA